MFDIKSLYEAKTVDEAVALRLKHLQAVIIAGGSDVLIKIREGKLAGCELISIHGIDALKGVRLEEDGTLRIGSLTSFARIMNDSIIHKHINVLAEAAVKVGGPQICAIGTIGGNTYNGVTSADCASTLTAWDAVTELTGPEGIRKIPIEKFYLSAGKVDIQPGEIQTGILIPKESYENTSGHYIKYGMRNAMEIAAMGCSVNVRLSPDKKNVERLRIAFGVAAPVPIRARKTESVFSGARVSRQTAEGISESVLDDVNPRDSWRASRDMRLHLCSEMAERAFVESVRLSGGEIE